MDDNFHYPNFWDYLPYRSAALLLSLVPAVFSFFLSSHCILTSYKFCYVNKSARFIVIYGDSSFFVGSIVIASHWLCRETMFWCGNLDPWKVAE